METTHRPSEWLRGVIGPAVLSIISEGETYGYVIAQRLSSTGLGKVKGGTLYPLLTRYEQDGLLEGVWRAGDGGPGRKYYTLTAKGRVEIRRLREEWCAFVKTATMVISGEEHE